MTSMGLDCGKGAEISSHIFYNGHMYVKIKKMFGYPLVLSLKLVRLKNFLVISCLKDRLPWRVLKFNFFSLPSFSLSSTQKMRREGTKTTLLPLSLLKSFSQLTSFSHSLVSPLVRLVLVTPPRQPQDLFRAHVHYYEKRKYYVLLP
jgi:hypothetical protein